ncbi:MAG: M24 family metallopeptidase [Acidimicrobiales bacterium]
MADTKPSTEFRSLGFDPARAARLMEEHGVGAVLVSLPENVYYTTGYPCITGTGNPILFNLKNRLPAFSCIGANGEPTLLCWAFSTYGVTFGAEKVVGYEDLGAAVSSVRQVVAEQLGPAEKLGIESTCPQYVLAALAEAGIDNERLVVVDSLLRALRLVKSPRELEVLEKSLEIAESCVDEIFSSLTIGSSRLALINEAKRYLFARGVDGISHITISFGTENPEIAIDEKLAENKLITLDVGAMVDGYCSDNRRYGFSGEIPEQITHLYKSMVAVVDSIGAVMKPGTPYSELFEHGKKLLIDGNITGHEWLNHVGHSIGLEIEEDWIDDRVGPCIEEDMVVAIELYTITDELVPIGNEETYHITPDGAKRLSMLPRELHRVA